MKDNTPPNAASKNYRFNREKRFYPDYDRLQREFPYRSENKDTELVMNTITYNTGKFEYKQDFETIEEIKFEINLLQIKNYDFIVDYKFKYAKEIFLFVEKMLLSEYTTVNADNNIMRKLMGMYEEDNNLNIHIALHDYGGYRILSRCVEVMCKGNKEFFNILNKEFYNELELFCTLCDNVGRIKLSKNF